MAETETIRVLSSDIESLRSKSKYKSVADWELIHEEIVKARKYDYMMAMEENDLK